MLKLQPAASECQQRRPTRILSSYESPSTRMREATSRSQSGNGSRLKCSTISKVPPAKSRVKQSQQAQQPVDCGQVMCAGQEAQKPSRLARLSAARGLRPSTLAVLNKSEPPQPTRISALPNKQQSMSNKHDLANKGSTQRASQHQSSEAKGSVKKGQSQVVVKRKYSTVRLPGTCAGTGTSATALPVAPSRGLERLSGGLKNLVAVVHPQHSQRVNSSATTTNGGTGKLLQPLTTPTTTKSSGGQRSESGKVNFNHKDVNGRQSEEKKEKESKQDESQIKPKAPNAKATPTSISMINASDQQSTLASASTTNDVHCSAVDRDKSDQFSQQSGNFSPHLLSVASNNGDFCDKKQHGNNKQSNKHLSAQTPPDSQATRLDLADHRQPDSRGAADQQPNEEDGSNCYYHHADSPDSTPNKSTAMQSPKHNTSAYAINDRIQPKPMGQQVLSLMMLDVGLLPANNHNQTPQSLPHKSSHVRIASSFRQDADASVTHSNPFFMSNASSLSADGHAADELKSSNNIDYDPPEQCKTHSSLQPEHEMLRLQVHFSNRANTSFKSISLPSSPRVLTETTRLGEKSHAERHDVLVCQPEPLVRYERSQRFTSPLLCHGQTKCNNQDRLLPVADIQDSLSMASSTSSINYYPPQLALSNQLNGLKFEELVRANFDSTAALRNQNNQSSPTINFKSKSRHSTDQVARVTKQHELLTNDLHTEMYEEQRRSDKIDEQAFTDRLGEDLLIKGSEFTEMVQKINNCPEFNLEPTEALKSAESCTDPQLRRQQHPRSHSISGQEYCSNNGYQRLKQSLYIQPGSYDPQQHYNGSGGNRINQVSSPYLSHQVTGRSPSPMSIGGQSQYSLSQREGSFKSSQERQVRNHLHASLECLNNGYADYNQNQPFQHNTHHLQSQQQQHQHVQNQHYAASYVLAAPTANTVINQNGDQDMAAAAMGTPPSHYQPTLNGAGNYSHQNQAFINRAMAQMSQSPLRRLGLHNTNTATSSGLLSHISNLHHPMRAGHSSLSLATSSFMIEDKLQNEIRKLHGELKSEKEKNEALSSQLNINSSLMAAFEQSLTTLNTRLRQLTTLNEKKDSEIEELRGQLKISSSTPDDHSQTELKKKEQISENVDKPPKQGEKDSSSEDLIKVVEDLKRKLIEKDRMLKDTRLEALRAALQLEQLESKLNGEHSILINDDDLDEGVMVVNHSPSDSDAVTDSTHLNEMSNQLVKINQRCSSDSSSLITSSSPNNRTGSSNNNASVEANNFYSMLDSSGEQNNNNSSTTTNNNNTDSQSNHSSEYLIESKENNGQTLSVSGSQHFEDGKSSRRMGEIMDSLLLSS